MRGASFWAGLVVPLLTFALADPARPAPAPDDQPTIRLARAGELKVADLVLNDAVVIDEDTVAVVGRKGDIGKPETYPPQNAGEPNGAIIDLARKSSRPLTNDHNFQIWGVAASGGRVFTGGTDTDPFLRVWDLKERKTVNAIEIRATDNFRVRCFHKSNRVVVGMLECLLVFDPARPQERLQLPCPSDVRYLKDEIAISPDDAWVACTADQGRVVYWEMATRKATTVSLRPRGAGDAEKWSATGVAFGPKGMLIAWRDGNSAEVPEGKAERDVPAERRAVVRIDLPGGKVVPLGMGLGVDTSGCAIDSTGRWLAAVGWSRPDQPRRDGATAAGELRVYDLSSKELVSREQVEERSLKWVSFTPAGKRVVAATIAGDVRWWDVKSR